MQFMKILDPCYLIALIVYASQKLFSGMPAQMENPHLTWAGNGLLFWRIVDVNYYNENPISF